MIYQGEWIALAMLLRDALKIPAHPENFVCLGGTMAGRHRIMCVEKGGGKLPHEMVTHVGGRTSTGTRWKISLAEAIGGMREGVWTFYVMVGRETLEIQIARDASGAQYLRTEIDGDGPASLLQLPDCSGFSGEADPEARNGGKGRAGSEEGGKDDAAWP